MQVLCRWKIIKLIGLLSGNIGIVKEIITTEGNKMRLDNCLKMIREEQDTPRGWTIRFNDLSNTINFIPISTTIDIDKLYNDWYGDCFSCPNNDEVVFDIMIAHEESGRCYLIEYPIDFEILMRKIEYQFYM